MSSLAAPIDTYASEHDCDVLLWAGPTIEPHDRNLIKAVRTRRHRSNLLFVLCTLGGSPDCAYRSIRHLQQVYCNSGGDGRITVLVDDVCKSAGTLMALGAHEIVMSEIAELGPLDIQTLEREEIGEYSSGLKTIEALQSVRQEALNTFDECFRSLRLGTYRFPTKLAAEVASKMAVGLSQALYEQIDPMRLAETTRAMRIMEEYADRIATDNCPGKSIGRLIASYPDHGFVIDLGEAQTLFQNARPPTTEETKISRVLRPMSENAINSNSTVVEYVSTEVADKGTATTQSQTGDVNESAIQTHGAGVGEGGPEGLAPASDGRHQDGSSDSSSEADREGTGAKSSDPIEEVKPSTLHVPTDIS